MTEEELKKKIVNTINHYEIRCRNYEEQIGVLKNGITKLSVLAKGNDENLDNQLNLLREDAKNDSDTDSLKSRMDFVTKLMMRLEEKKEKGHCHLKDMIARLSASLNGLSLGVKEKREISSIMELIENDESEQIIVDKFNQLFNDFLSNMVKQIDFFKAESTNKSKKKSLFSKSSKDILSVEPMVNSSLQELLENLTIPKELELEANNINRVLTQQLSNETLPEIIDAMTELVIESFNLEQKRFKGFLEQLTTRLSDVEEFLHSTSDSDAKGYDETQNLECGIKDSIDEIKLHFDNANSIEELEKKISSNLEIIIDTMKDYKTNAKKRIDESEVKINALQSQLDQTHSTTEELQISLSFQKYRAKRDSLTGLPNRESYDEHMLDAFRRWERGFGELAIAVGDIDEFKRVNDNFGHLAGDKVLKKIASILKSSIRSVDFAARYGGEEFVLIFERTGVDDAHHIADKLRKSVADCQFHFKDTPVEVTMSFGITEMAKNDTIESLFARADDALYDAKRAGRNKVITH
jgi:diguanylate cyclase